MILPGLLRFHRAALRYDFRTLGLDLDDLLSERMSWNVAWEYVSEILRDLSSHLVSALQGDKYVPAAAERAAWAVFEQWLNAQVKGRTVRVSRPWAGTKPTYKSASVTQMDAAREARRARLAAMF